MMKLLVKSLTCIGALASMQAALAQEQKKVEKIEVTGSNIKRVEVETASPIQIIKREDIERSGVTTVNEALQKISSNSIGADERIVNTFSPGGAALNLRNLGFNSTLVLVNGRRLSTFPFAQQFGTAQGFQDLNAIPLGAVDRIEILKDGASAVYGADAVAGVINIILRNDYRGAEVSARLSDSTEGDAKGYSVNATWGFGSQGQGLNGVINLSHQHSDRIASSARDFAANEDLRSRGGSDFRSSFSRPGTYIDLETGATTPFPSCTTIRAGFCRLNRAETGDLLPKIDRTAIFGRFTLGVGANAELFAEAGFNRHKSLTTGFGAPTDIEPTLGRVNFMILPTGHNSNPFGKPIGIRYRFLEVGTRDDDVVADNKRLLVGAKGVLAGLDWETAYVYGKIDVDNKQVNNIVINQLTAVLNQYNFLNPSANSAQLLDSLRFTDSRTGSSDLKGFDAKVSGELFALAGGPLAFALGAETRKESVFDTSSKENLEDRLLGKGSTSAFGDRSVSAVFAELNAPLTRTLEAVAALRADRYSGNYKASATSPKIALRWTPSRSALFRASWGKAFRAPSLFETTPAGTIGFEFGIRDPIRCRTGSEPDCGLDINVVTSGNSALQPEKSTVGNVGTVIEPVEGVTFALDYFKIDRKDEIGTFAVQQLVDLFPNDPNIVSRNVAGEIFRVNSVPINLNKTKVKGVDADLRVNVGLGGWGKLQVFNSASYYQNYEFTSVSADAAGRPIQVSVGLLGSYNTPRWKRQHGATWLKGAWEVTLRGDYLPETDQLNPTTLGNGNKIGRQETYHVFGQYSGAKNLKVVFGVNNILDRAPPFANESSATNAGYNQTLHSPLGRTFYLGATYTLR